MEQGQPSLKVSGGSGMGWASAQNPPRRPGGRARVENVIDTGKGAGTVQVSGDLDTRTSQQPPPAFGARP
jgi:hypothetical protein